jgi:7,8-dihydroneopterin aldolase/epimerase/oxygenase
MPNKPDQIVISQLGIATFIGATEEERKKPQRLRVSVSMEPKMPFSAMHDRLENTVDYAEVSTAIKTLAATGQRLLIETLGEEIAMLLLRTYPISAVEIELRKYILPDTEFVAVRLRREAQQDE